MRLTNPDEITDYIFSLHKMKNIVVGTVRRSRLYSGAKKLILTIRDRLKKVVSLIV